MEVHKGLNSGRARDSKRGGSKNLEGLFGVVNMKSGEGRLLKRSMGIGGGGGRSTVTQLGLGQNREGVHRPAVDTI